MILYLPCCNKYLPIFVTARLRKGQALCSVLGKIEISVENRNFCYFVKNHFSQLEFCDVYLLGSSGNLVARCG